MTYRIIQTKPLLVVWLQFIRVIKKYLVNGVENNWKQ